MMMTTVYAQLTVDDFQIVTVDVIQMRMMIVIDDDDDDDVDRD